MFFIEELDPSMNDGTRSTPMSKGQADLMKGLEPSMNPTPAVLHRMRSPCTWE